MKEIDDFGDKRQHLKPMSDSQTQTDACQAVAHINIASKSVCALASFAREWRARDGRVENRRWR